MSWTVRKSIVTILPEEVLPFVSPMLPDLLLVVFDSTLCLDRAL